MTELGPMLSGVTGVLGGVLVLLVGKFVNRRTDRATATKVEAEASKATAEAGAIIQAGYEQYVKALEQRVAGLESRVSQLEAALHAERAQVSNLRKLLRSTARWSLTLRDEVIRLGGDVPPMPADVEFALTTLDPPE
jgi:hypothetical protein